MRNINQFDLSSKSYPNDDQVKLIPAFLNKFARSRDVNYLFKFANKISKESSISEKIKNGWNGTQSIKNHVILLKMKTTISHEFLTQNSQSVIQLRKLNC